MHAVQAAQALEQAVQGLQEHPAVVATRAALAEAAGDAQAALGVVTAALQQRGVDFNAKRVQAPRGADMAAIHWLLQRLAGLQLQVCGTAVEGAVEIGQLDAWGGPRKMASIDCDI